MSPSLLQVMKIFGKKKKPISEISAPYQVTHTKFEVQGSSVTPVASENVYGIEPEHIYTNVQRAWNTEPREQIVQSLLHPSERNLKIPTRRHTTKGSPRAKASALLSENFRYLLSSNKKKGPEYLGVQINQNQLGTVALSCF